MTNPESLSSLDPQFNGFLFAPIAEDRDGITLSVLSALARRDVDPWEEAAKLASLPGETAISRLATLIDPLPDGPTGSLDPTTIAARLIALLPSHSSSGADLRAKAATLSATNFWWPIVAMGFMALALSAQMYLASHQPAATASVAPAHAYAPVTKAAPRLEAVDTASYSQPAGID